MDKLIVSYFSQVILFSIFPFYFATIKTYFRNNLFYVYLGVVLGFGGLLGQVWAIELTDTIRISGGNIAYAAFMMTSIMFVVLEQDIVIARNIIKLVIVVNIFKYFLFNSIYAFLSNPQFINLNSVSPKVFSNSAAMMLVGGFLIITELILFLFVFEKIKKMSKQSFITILLFTIFFIILLCLDGILFPLINFRLFPDLSSVIIGGIKNKLVLGASFSPAMLFILIVFRKRFENYLNTDLLLKNILKKSKEDLALIVQEQFEEIKVSEEKYRTLYETMAQGVVYQDVEGKIISVNPSAEAILGLSIDQMQGKTSMDSDWRSIHEDGSEFPGETHPSMIALQTGKPVKNIIMGIFSQKTGSTRWININAIPKFKEGEESPYQVYTTFEDITDYKLSEKERRESDERFRIAQEMSPDGFTILRPVRDDQDQVIDFTWIYENEAVARMNGTDPKKVVGQRLLELFPGHQGTQFFKAYKQVAETGKPITFEEAYVGETIKNKIWFRLVVVPMAENIAILNQDITERKRAEENLINTFNLSPSIIAKANLKTGFYIEANQAVTRILGYSIEEFTSKPIKEFIHPDDKETTIEAMSEQLKSK